MSREQSLREYLDRLERERPQEILRISDELDPDYVLTSLVLKLEERKKYPVVFLERVKGTEMPVAANLFASRERFAHMLGVPLEELSKRWVEAEHRLTPPRQIEDGPVREVIVKGEEVDLYKFPISRHFADDAGRYVSSAIIFAKDPDTGVVNLSYHRMQLKEKNRFGISLHSRGHLWDYFRRAEERNEALEIAAVIGTHPLLYLAAGTKLSLGVSELDLAGALMGVPVETVAGAASSLPVPAESELVFEGRILPAEREEEGPFGEYTGYSTFRSTENVFIVDAVMHRKHPIFLDLVPGPSTEHLFLGGIGKESNVIERLKERIDTVRAVNFPKSGTHFHAYLSIKKTAEGQARYAAMLLFGLDPYLKLVITVDEDIDVFNDEEVLWAVATRVRADKDVIIVPDVLCNRLDPSSHDGMQAKMAIDATAPLDWDVMRCRTDEGADNISEGLIERLGL